MYLICHIIRTKNYIHDQAELLSHAPRRIASNLMPIVIRERLGGVLGTPREGGCVRSEDEESGVFSSSAVDVLDYGNIYVHRNYRYRQLSSTSDNSPLIRIPDSPVIIRKQRKRKATKAFPSHSTPSPFQKKLRRGSIRKSKVLKRKKVGITDFEANVPPVKIARQYHASSEVSYVENGTDKNQEEAEEFKINVANDEGLDGRPWNGNGESEQGKIQRQKREYWDRLTLEAVNFHEQYKVSSPLQSEDSGGQLLNV
uniref:Origin recognition complex subunit 1 n=1 Tax=Heterorhabditis bacteriophora TaxID=37862 RepID=A0A1I7X402_HETBA